MWHSIGWCPALWATTAAGRAKLGQERALLVAAKQNWPDASVNLLQDICNHANPPLWDLPFLCMILNDACTDSDDPGAELQLATLDECIAIIDENLCSVDERGLAPELLSDSPLHCLSCDFVADDPPRP